jgi:hypothetical protein
MHSVHPYQGPEVCDDRPVAKLPTRSNSEGSVIITTGQRQRPSATAPADSRAAAPEQLNDFLMTPDASGGNPCLRLTSPYRWASAAHHTYTPIGDGSRIEAIASA